MWTCEVTRHSLYTPHNRAGLASSTYFLVTLRRGNVSYAYRLIFISTPLHRHINTLFETHRMIKKHKIVTQYKASEFTLPYEIKSYLLVWGGQNECDLMEGVLPMFPRFYTVCSPGSMFPTFHQKG